MGFDMRRPSTDFAVQAARLGVGRVEGAWRPRIRWDRLATRCGTPWPRYARELHPSPVACRTVSIGVWEAGLVADDLGFAQMADGREVAYRVVSGGVGPVIVHQPNGAAPIDLLNEDPMYDRFVRTLASHGRLVLYDSLGVGSSDPNDPDRDHFSEWIGAHLAVLDAVEAQSAWIVGNHLAATAETIRAHADRVSGAVLVNGITRRHWKRVLDIAASHQRITPLEVAGEAYPSRADDPAFLDWLRRIGRLGVSKSVSAAKMESNRAAMERFIREARPILNSPPVMLIRRRDAMSDAELEWWNGIFPDAECITIEGADMDIPGLDAGLIAELAVGFITGIPIAPPVQRKLVAVMFTDLVDSTTTVAASGDTVWRSTLDRYEVTLQSAVQRHHGTVIKHTGDGALVTFPSGSESIRAAVELRNATRDLDMEARTGIHLGEVEQRGADIGGIAVHLAARVIGVARPGEILVTSTVADSSTGGAFRFADRGLHSLRGLRQPRHLLAVDLDGP
jgi:class 3 adenylate cyclase